MKAPVVSQYSMGEMRRNGVARPSVSEKGRGLGARKEERGSSEDGETLVLKGVHGPTRSAGGLASAISVNDRIEQLFHSLALEQSHAVYSLYCTIRKAAWPPP